MAMRSLSLAVVGSQYPNDDKKAPTRFFAIGLCRPGDPVQLVPAPKNKHDDQAIMVLNSAGMMMGYITAERAPMVSRWISEGREVAAIYQKPMKGGAWIRVALDGEAPTLPPETVSEPVPVADDSGFYPDEVWPDE